MKETTSYSPGVESRSEQQLQTHKQLRGLKSSVQESVEHNNETLKKFIAKYEQIAKQGTYKTDTDFIKAMMADPDTKKLPGFATFKPDIPFDTLYQYDNKTQKDAYLLTMYFIKQGYLLYPRHLFTNPVRKIFLPIALNPDTKQNDYYTINPRDKLANMYGITTLTKVEILNINDPDFQQNGVCVFGIPFVNITRMIQTDVSTYQNLYGSDLNTEQKKLMGNTILQAAVLNEVASHLSLRGPNAERRYQSYIPMTEPVKQIGSNQSYPYQMIEEFFSTEASLDRSEYEIESNLLGGMKDLALTQLQGKLSSIRPNYYYTYGVMKDLCMDIIVSRGETEISKYNAIIKKYIDLVKANKNINDIDADTFLQNSFLVPFFKSLTPAEKARIKAKYSQIADEWRRSLDKVVQEKMKK